MLDQMIEMSKVLGFILDNKSEDLKTKPYAFPVKPVGFKEQIADSNFPNEAATHGETLAQRERESCTPRARRKGGCNVQLKYSETNLDKAYSTGGDMSKELHSKDWCIETPAKDCRTSVSKSKVISNIYHNHVVIDIQDDCKTNEMVHNNSPKTRALVPNYAVADSEDILAHYNPDDLKKVVVWYNEAVLNNRLAEFYNFCIPMQWSYTCTRF